MAVLQDYIRWRGDLSFEQDGFNAFDNMVFSSISYVEMDYIFSHSESDELTLAEIAKRYYMSDNQVPKLRDNSVLKECPILLRQAAQCPRYRDVVVRNYVNRISIEMTLQFAAMEFVLPDGSSFVAFRGTDDTIVGWKEDFLMAVTEVEAEKESVEYLNFVAAQSKRPIRVGGHSKGGHLAVYSSAFCEERVKERILQIYSNDGPGFLKSFVDDPRTKEVEDRILHIIPEESIVGMLMEPVGKRVVVKSVNKAFLQHDLLSWCLDAMAFDTVDEVSHMAEIMDKSVKEWIDEFEESEIGGFVEELFSVLTASEVETLTEIQEGGVRVLQKMTRRMNSLSPKTKEKILQFLKSLFTELME